MADAAAIDCGPPRLPAEVLEIIFVIAATGDQQTACSLALVSRAVCRLTMEARSSTAVLTSMKSAKRFFVTLNHSAYLLESVRLMCPKTPVSDMIEDLGGKRLLSRTQQGSLKMENLYIDMHDFDEQEWHGFLRTLADCCYSLAEPCSCHSCYSRQETHHIDDDDKNISIFVENLSLGPAESSYHSPKDKQPCQLTGRSLTVVIDGSAQGDPLRHWIGTFALQRLHVVGRDSQSEDAGLAPPLDLLDASRAGSTESIQHQDTRLRFKNTWYSWYDRPQLTHIRWDTRRFAFQPIEITVQRLAPLLLEICFAEECGKVNSDSTAGFAYSGPRHAAPGHGAGHAGNGTHQVDATSVAQDDSDEAKMLRKAGVSRFKRLHFAWDLPTKLLEEQNTTRNDAQYHGGWPRESHDVWTERNKRGRVQTFRSELVEAVTEAYGWAPADASRKPSQDEVNSWSGQYRFASPAAGHMVDEVATGAMRKHFNFLETIEGEIATEIEQEAQRRKEKPRGTGRKLKYAVRAPSTLLKLGEATAALDSETRLALFLDCAQGGPGSWA